MAASYRRPWSYSSKVIAVDDGDVVVAEHDAVGSADAAAVAADSDVQSFH